MRTIRVQMEYRETRQGPLRKWLKDGPYSVRIISLLREDGHNSQSIATGAIAGPVITTQAYRRDQWDGGDLWLEDEVKVRGLFPATSGRFRLVELAWGVTTPGGRCRWTANLGPFGSLPAASGALLPTGRSVIRLVFDGATVARGSDKQWPLYRNIVCGMRVAEDDQVKRPSVTIDPAQFEPPRASFSIDAEELLRLHPGEQDGAKIHVRRRSPDGVTFQVGPVPAGISVKEPVLNGSRDYARTYSDCLFSADVFVSPGVAAGEYFVPILATADGQTASTALVVDVIR